MSNKKQVEKDKKVRIVRECLKGKIGPSKGSKGSRCRSSDSIELDGNL